AHPGEVVAAHVGDDLRDAAQLDLVARRGLAHRVDVVGEPDVVRGPGAVPLFDRRKLVANRLRVHDRVSVTPLPAPGDVRVRTAERLAPAQTGAHGAEA